MDVCALLYQSDDGCRLTQSSRLAQSAVGATTCLSNVGAFVYMIVSAIADREATATMVLEMVFIGFMLTSKSTRLPIPARFSLVRPPSYRNKDSRSVNFGRNLTPKVVIVQLSGSLEW